MNKTCIDCGTPISDRRHERCHSCAAKRRWIIGDFPISQAIASGSASIHWKGGIQKHPNGYLIETIDRSDFFAQMACFRPKMGPWRVLQHRLVMARHLKRCLLSWEIVHHKNGNKDDNRIENLELLPDTRFHLLDVGVKRRIATLEKRVTMLEAENTALRAELESLTLAKVSVSE